jgi:polyadenylate-binding protein 2
MNTNPCLRYISQEIMLMKQRVEEMEREAKKLRELQAEAEKAAATAAADGDDGAGGQPEEDTAMMEEDKALVDNRSVYVGNVRLFAPPGSISILLFSFVHC